MFKDLTKIFTPEMIISVVILSIILTGLAMLVIWLDTKKYKTFRKDVNKGDEVYASITSGGYDGIVTNIDEEWVTIESKVRKHRIYPKTKKSK
jgi:preprotein translocase subunit YajC